MAEQEGQGSPADEEHVPPVDSGTEPGEEHRGKAPPLAPKEFRKATEEESLNARTTYEVVRREGEHELQRSPSSLAWSGLAAGLSMGFSYLTQAFLQLGMPDRPWRHLVATLGYTVGFLIVTLGSQQLFTENTLTPIVPLLTKRTGKMLQRTVVLWAVVFITNIIGALLFAWAIGATEVVKPEVHEALGKMAHEAIEPSFGVIMLRGVFAGWLIALMVWMLPASQSAHFWVIIIMTWVIGLGHFSHVIAGSTEVFYLAVRGEISFAAAFTHFIIPALIGNVAGGVTLVTAVNHAQVAAAGKEKESQGEDSPSRGRIIVTR